MTIASRAALGVLFVHGLLACFYELQTIASRDFADYSENGYAAPKCGQPGSHVCASI